MGRTFGIIALIAGVAVTRAEAQTLPQALALAYLSNPTLEAARADLRGKDETIVQAKADLWRPKVSFSAGVSRNLSGQVASFSNPFGYVDFTPQDRDDGRNFSVNILFNIFKGGQTVEQIRYAKAVIAAQRASLTNTEQQVFLNVSQAYTEIIMNITKRDLYAQDEHNLGLLKAQVETFFQSQQATITEVAEVTAELAQARVRREQAAGDLAVAQSRFNALVGTYPTSVRHWPTPPQRPAIIDDAIALALRQSPQILAAQNTLVANEAALAGAQGTVLPTLDLVITWGRSVDRIHASGQESFDSFSENYFDNTRTNSYSIGLKFEMPLYEGGALTSRIRQQRQAVSKARSQFDEAERSVRDNVSASWALVDTALARLQGANTQVEAARVALTGNERQYQDGRSTLRDVLLARQKLDEAIIQKIVSRHELALASEKLSAAMGRYNAKDLELPVKLYDPFAYYDKVKNDFWR
jgi:outer membrane protein